MRNQLSTPAQLQTPKQLPNGYGWDTQPSFYKWRSQLPTTTDLGV